MGVRQILLGVLGIVCIAALSGCRSPAPAPAQSTAPREEFPRQTGPDPGLTGSDLTRGGEAGAIALRTIYFDYDEYTLRSDARSDLQANADMLRANAGVRIEIQGNCDERGTAEYNLALGQRRADAARRYLVDLGVDASRIDTISFGEERPAVVGHNEAAWAKNRRDDFVVR
jgi:peptidoglycan-associated lipoprotein